MKGKIVKTLLQLTVKDVLDFSGLLIPFRFLLIFLLFSLSLSLSHSSPLLQYYIVPGLIIYLFVFFSWGLIVLDA
jgi:hypothetical protein